MKNGSKRPVLVVLELGRVVDTPLTGGDKLAPHLFQKLSRTFRIHVFISAFGHSHWNSVTAFFTVCRRTLFDRFYHPILVFLTYVYRILWATYQLFWIRPDILYSSTNVFVDVLPAFLYCLFHRHCFWIGRVHHLVTSPYSREGSFTVNVFSFLVDRLAVLLLRRAHLVFALNITLSKALLRHGFLASKVHVSGAGIDIVHSNNIQKETVVLFVGRLHPTKGIFDLPIIWRKVLADVLDARLVIVGGGPVRYKEALVALFDRDNTLPSVTFAGYVSDSELSQLYSKAMVFLFTDHEAGFGVAPLEALSHGVPVVGYSIGILGDVFKRGYLTSPLGNYESFSQNIVSILTQHRLREKLSREALEEARRHTWDSVSDEFSTTVVDYFSAHKKTVPQSETKGK